MLSERYRPKTWTDFIGQPVIDEIVEACTDPWLFDGCGERWLFESDGIAGCGKTSAAYVAAQALGCSDFATERIDSRACMVADLRALDSTMRAYGMGSENGRRCYIIDEIQHLNRDCQRMLLGILENLPCHVIVIGTTTSVTWADEVDGLFSRWRRFRFRKPSAPAIAEHLERIAREQSLPIPDGFRILSYVQGKYTDVGGNNIRACVDLLPDALRRYKGKADIRAALGGIGAARCESCCELQRFHRSKSAFFYSVRSESVSRPCPAERYEEWSEDRLDELVIRHRNRCYFCELRLSRERRARWEP